MKRFTDAGRASIATDNLYAALSLALMLPDICGSLEDPGPGKSKERYLSWYTQWAQPKFSAKMPPNGELMAFISADDCFQLRCSLIHSGSSVIEPGKKSNLNNFLFFDKTAGMHLLRFDEAVIDGVQQSFLQLKADRFSETMYLAADEWDAAMKGNAKVQAEKAKLLVIQSAGYVMGKGAIKFGQELLE